MDIDKLKQFKVIAECENLSKAADVLHITQPALSKCLSHIEDEMGVKFFDRTKNQIVLNQNGKIFLSSSNRILDEYDNVYATLNSGRGEGQSVRISATNDFLLRFADTEIAPKFSKTETDGSSLDDCTAKERLKNGTTDFVFSSYRFTEPEFKSSYLCTDINLAIVPMSHPLSKRDNLTLLDLDGENLFLYKSESASSQHILKYLKSNSVTVNLSGSDDPFIFINKINSNNDIFSIVGLLLYRKLPIKYHIIKPLLDTEYKTEIFLNFTRKRMVELRPYAETIKKVFVENTIIKD